MLTFLLFGWGVLGGLSALSVCDGMEHREPSWKQSVFVVVLGLPMWLFFAVVLLPVLIPLGIVGYLGYLATKVSERLG